MIEKNHRLESFLATFVGVNLMLLSLSGCVNSNVDDLSNYIRDVNARPKGPIEPLPEIKVIETFVFQPEGLRDPFQAVAMNAGFDADNMEGLRPDSARRKEELEFFALETIQMVGTLSLKSELWGLVRLSDGSGTVYRVRVGNYMGKNNGKINRIAENRIELIEIVPDNNQSGVWIEQQASLVLAE